MYSGLTSGSIYGLVALGFNIIYNTTGIINFAQGEFVMIGGMFIYMLFAVMGLPFPIAFIGAVGGAFIIGVIFEKFFHQADKDKERTEPYHGDNSGIHHLPRPCDAFLGA